jgi:hypothetical protein
MIVRIEVTQADIDDGEPGEPCTCPVALAIRRIGPDCDPQVDRLCVVFGEGSGYCEAELPAAATRFIDDFDRLCGVFADYRSRFAPFAFDVEIPGSLLAAVTS